MVAELRQKLDQEEMDNVIYDSRFGDLETLTNIFTNEVEPKVLMTIQDEYSLSTPIHMAAANGHVDIVKYLLSIIPKEDATILVNKQNDMGNTALHWAAYNGHLEVIKVLCEYEADPFIKNNAEHDAIYEAENNNKEEVEDYFLQKYSIEPEEGENENEGETDDKIDQDDAKTAATVSDESNVKFSKGTEIKIATEESKNAMLDKLGEKIENLELSDK
ncbi:hypothetical protein BVG19_g2130 [[Candida] boidinii]|nr:hypothetical protein BVG19_g2130 [[Candida] boidinii]OWB51789.1 hypothetical protein B5S27_g3357 [[Candida] boidinii]OWB82254.1 hypothetical protein B5S33_g878 [[Candida] boidinii]